MPRLGVLSKFYINVGNVQSVIWQELPLISDMNVGGSWDEGDASARLSRAKTMEPTMMGIEISGKVRVKDARLYTGYILMYECWYTDSILHVMALNGPATEEGAEGFAFQAKVFAWSEDQGLGAVLFKDFTLKPCIPTSAQNAPKIARSLGSNGPGIPNMRFSDIGTGFTGV